ncbi:MAG: transporter [Phenylobacterium sp.]|jgi:multidrug efflux system outer membrane protein|nr:transporter [Phenylobacterium sp.]
MMRALTLAMAACLAGCSFQTPYVQPPLPVPASWPRGDPYLSQSEADLPKVTYRDVFTDPRLLTLIEQSQANNRTLRVALANIRASRAQYRIQRAQLLPWIDLTGRYSRTGGKGSTATTPGTSSAPSGASYAADVGVTAYEIDLFGRIRSLTDAALNLYFASEFAARSTRVILIAAVANAWLTYASDASLLQIALDTVVSAEGAVRLNRALLRGGVAPRTAVLQAETILATAQADVALQRSLVAEDVNALQLLLGSPVDPALLPTSIEDASKGLRTLPVGLPSTVLLRRPDVMQAEYQLRAANAEVGAARAALFPTISLTAALGYASPALSSLFTSGAYSYSVAPSASYPIFRAGAGLAGVAYSRAQREAALAAYEYSIQAAFRETANALARQGTIADQLAAMQTEVTATRGVYGMTYALYRGGIDTFLATLLAQQALYTARRTQVATQFAAATNQVLIYQSIGGETTEPARAP